MPRTLPTRLAAVAAIVFLGALVTMSPNAPANDRPDDRQADAPPPADAALAGLLHDAAEAYVGDVLKPLKDAVPAHRELESPVMLAIGARFGVDFAEHWTTIKSYDRAAAATEARDLGVFPGADGWIDPDYAIGPRIEPVQTATYVGHILGEIPGASMRLSRLHLDPAQCE